MPLQTVPPLARSYNAAQRAAIDAALLEISAQWRRIGPRFDTGWSLVGPYIAAIVASAQRDVIDRASEFTPALLEDTGQTRYLPTEFTPNAAALVGVTGNGYLVTESLSVATIRAKQAVADGHTAPQALTLAGSWLAQSSLMVLADTMRSTETLGQLSHRVGYVRMVHGGACGRCVVQAGKWFRTNAGFLRHPRCRCTHIPASEDVGRSWQTNPDEYFHSLSQEQQIKLMGSKANAQAVIDGADINQIVNAYRKTSGMQFAQVQPIKTVRGMKYTTEGATRRSLATQQQTGLRRNGRVQQRLMPESIARIAKDADDRMRLLRLYGWVLDDTGLTTGRNILAEQRRVARNARARARRAEAAWLAD